ncbi:NfeD family protein [Marinicrinis sediminis]|uniref:Nodulation protein NfeD n=1 Tax=Marinicrinis sediminis TaxID=1652465 RepID=A0ABW5RBE9_9BACL
MNHRNKLHDGPARRLLAIGIGILLCLSFLLPTSMEAADQTSDRTEGNKPKLIYMIPVENTIEQGLQSFLERSFKEAKNAGADQIILRVNTFGGRVDSAIEIGQLIRESDIPTLAYVEGKALSAGSYLSLNADQIVMSPGSTIGAAAVVDGAGNRVEDSKVISAWVAFMRAAAEHSGRNPLYAAGMVDDQLVVEVPEIDKTFEKGELIAFSAEQAQQVGFAEAKASTMDQVLDWLQADESQIVELELTFFEQLATWITSPIIATLLLFIGLAGVVMELLIPGFGIPGIAGLLAFGLYFFGNMVAGFAGLEHIVLFAVGVVLLIAEMFIPSFGILGTSGVVSLMTGVVFAAYDTGQAFVSLGIAAVAAVIFLAVMIRIFKHKGIWNRFILRDELQSQNGYVSQMDRKHLLHVEGKALSDLRPSGVAIINGVRTDVVSSGGYIDEGSAIRVIQVEGTRVVVELISDQA